MHDIYCENFMCHKKLELKFNKNVNFINGQNGSGARHRALRTALCIQ